MWEFNLAIIILILITAIWDHVILCESLGNLDLLTIVVNQVISCMILADVDFNFNCGHSGPYYFMQKHSQY